MFFSSWGHAPCSRVAQVAFMALTASRRGFDTNLCLRLDGLDALAGLPCLSRRRDPVSSGTAFPCLRVGPRPVETSMD